MSERGGWRAGAGKARFTLANGESLDRRFPVRDGGGGGDKMVSALGAVGEAFWSWNAGNEVVGEMVFDTVDSWARQGRRNAGGRMKD